jgi:hypothetical protein
MSNIVTVLIATRLFTDPLISQVDAQVFSTPSLVLVMIWGLAYLAVAPHWRKVPQMCLVFMAEKLVYVTLWSMWILESRSQLSGLWEINWQIALFYGGYGIVDMGFSAFFFWAWTLTRRSDGDDAVRLRQSPVEE